MWNARTASEIAMMRRTPLHERAVDVAKRAEQIAVVVVAGRDERQCAARARRSIRTRRHGPCACAGGRAVPSRTARDERRGEPRRHVVAARHASPRASPRSSSARWNRSASPPASSERKRASTPALAQRRQQREQMLLGAADPLHLGQVQHLHASRILRYRRSTSSDHPLGREPIAHPACAFGAQALRAEPASARSRSRCAASARTSPIGARSPVSPSSTTVPRAAGVGRDDGHAGGERLDRDDRRALVGRRQEERVERGVPRAEVVDVAEKPHAIGDAEGRARAARPRRAARRPRRATSAASGHAGASTRIRSSGPLDLGQPAGPADHERRRRARLRRVEPRGPAPTSRSVASRSNPYGMTANLSRGATPKAHEVVAHLVADRDERVGRVRERTLRRAGYARSRRGAKYPLRT